MRTQFTICTEADYLRAHLTVIQGESPRWHATFYKLKQRVMSILKKWIAQATAGPPARSNPPLKLRAITMSPRFGAAADLAARL